MPGPHVPTLEAQERRFALALFFPALAVLLIATTVPLVYLAWNSLYRLDLSMPWLSGFTGLGNYIKMGSDPRFGRVKVLRSSPGFGTTGSIGVLSTRSSV